MSCAYPKLISLLPFACYNIMFVNRYINLRAHNQNITQTVSAVLQQKFSTHFIPQCPFSTAVGTPHSLRFI